MNGLVFRERYQQSIEPIMQSNIAKLNSKLRKSKKLKAYKWGTKLHEPRRN